MSNIQNKPDMSVSTVLSFDRTFMAAIRTNAIFVGISLLLFNKNIFKNVCLIISIASLIINVWTSFIYSKIFLYELNKNFFDMIFLPSTSFAIGLGIVQILCVYYMFVTLYL